LPRPPTSFVGRQSTVEVLRCRLEHERLVTLVGPGGCGKTRLAIEVGSRAAGSRPDGVFFVDLAGLSDPGLVPGTVLRALGIPEGRHRDPLETLAAQLSDRDLLLIIDNCEHLIEASAMLASAVSADCPDVRLLATSRERLGVPGEAVVALGGLELSGRAGNDDEGSAERSEAGRLFVDRARMARADFLVDNPCALASICERLDGIPLALELAAARTRLMSLDAIAEGLSDRFRFLVGAERTGPPRHKTLSASIEWSCALLSDNERHLLHRLSVFASGFTLAAAEAVGGDDEVDPHEVLALLTSLVDKSLVQVVHGADRFRLHETMRAYAAMALTACGATSARDRHLDYVTKLVKSMDPKTLTSQVSVALACLWPELDNLRVALDWATESEQFDAGAELMSSAGNFFNIIGVHGEALARCELLLTFKVDQIRRADLLYWASAFARYIMPTDSLGLALELTALGRSFGEAGTLARGLCRVAAIQAWSEPEEGVKAADQAVRLARENGLNYLVVTGLQLEALAYCWLRRPEEALPCAEEAVQVARQFDLLWHEAAAQLAVCVAAKFSGRLLRCLDEANTLLRLGAQLPGYFSYVGDQICAEAYTYLGDPRGVDAFARARSEAEALGHEYPAATIEAGQGELLVSLGREDEGFALVEEANTRLEALGLSYLCVNWRAVLAEVALRRGDLCLARSHLDKASGRVQQRTAPEAVPVLRAEARLARAEGDMHRSHALACDGLGAAFRGGHGIWVVDLLELTAITCADLERDEEAARLLGAAEHQRELTKYARWVPARDELAPVLAKIDAALGTGPFERAVCEGRRLALGAAVDYARRGRGSRSHAASGWDSLTPSERRVASLVGKRLSNAEIAGQLFISEATVKSHLNHVFDKLGMTNRRQLVAAVPHRHGE
jgi:predicted ATPase/DNA-binding CsgD family transcriptional regulator